MYLPVRRMKSVFFDWSRIPCQVMYDVREMKKAHKYSLIFLAAAGAIGLMHDLTKSDNPSCTLDAPKEVRMLDETKGSANTGLCR